MEHKLSCCIVRDLLPAYIEGLTEEETARQVSAHLADCPACRQAEVGMRAQVPVEVAPRRSMNFLRRVERTRLLAAVLAAAVALAGLLCAWWLYGQNFYWREDDASLALALEQHVLALERRTREEALKGAEGARIVEYWIQGEELTAVFSVPGSRGGVRGAAFFHRGLNGRYQFLSARYASFSGSGVCLLGLARDGEGERDYLIMMDDCEEVGTLRLTFDVTPTGGGPVLRQETVDVPVTGAEAAMLFSTGRVPHTREETVWLSCPENVAVLDREGRDVTARYLDPDAAGRESTTLSGTPERERLQWCTAAALAVAAVSLGCGVYFLRREKR